VYSIVCCTACPCTANPASVNHSASTAWQGHFLVGCQGISSSTTPLHHGTALPSHHCTAVPLYRCTGVSLRAIAPLHSCTAAVPQIYELFSKVGVVQRVIMGLDRNTKTPCGFCFVIYHTRAGAQAAVKFLNGTRLDNRSGCRAFKACGLGYAMQQSRRQSVFAELSAISGFWVFGAT
jgi:hypothetical protein